MLNSCLDRFTATHFWAPLIANLRGHFAEFLGDTSPDHLRILSSPTCVGLRYGCRYTLRSFSRQLLRPLRYLFSLPIILARPVCISPDPHKYLATHSAVWLAYLSASLLSLLICSTGISTCCPSSTPLGLDLGPD